MICPSKQPHQSEPARGGLSMIGRPDPGVVGDGFDEERLLTARELADWLRLPQKSVYELPIPRIVLGPRRIRWRPSDVRDFLSNRIED